MTQVRYKHQASKDHKYVVYTRTKEGIEPDLHPQDESILLYTPEEAYEEAMKFDQYYISVDGWIQIEGTANLEPIGVWTDRLTDEG